MSSNQLPTVKTTSRFPSPCLELYSIQPIPPSFPPSLASFIGYWHIIKVGHIKGYANIILLTIQPDMTLHYQDMCIMSVNTSPDLKHPNETRSWICKSIV
jgi:hypothetical protein